MCVLTAYSQEGSSLKRTLVTAETPVPEDAVWLDLFNPAAGEDKIVEGLLGIEVPTREEMQEIEVSSRLYIEQGSRYMTATLMCKADTALPRVTAVTFILANHRLVTVRYDEPKPFEIIDSKLTRACPAAVSGESVLLDLLDAIIDRLADILERVGMEIDAVSHDIFDPHGQGPDRSISYKAILKRIGSKGDLASKVRESLVSIGRLLLFLTNEDEGVRWPNDSASHIISMRRDVQSLSDHATYLSSKTTFLLDAMLGVVTIEQNNIIKIFSVAAVGLMPPTLVGTVYGMNFKYMPELEWPLGYPLALALMVLSAILPYFFFRWKKWL